MIDPDNGTIPGELTRDISQALVALVDRRDIPDKGDELSDRLRGPADGRNAVADFFRTGILRFSLGLKASIRQISIESKGEFEFQTLREDGEEDNFRSSCILYEMVDTLDLTRFTNWKDKYTGKYMDYAEPAPLMPVAVQVAQICGGRMKDGRTTNTSTSLNVTASNSVVFGPAGGGSEYWLFIAGPWVAIKDSFYPQARRILGPVRMDVVNLSEAGAPLISFAVDPFDGVWGINIETILRRKFPDTVFSNKRIGFRLVHQVSGSSPNPDEPNMAFLGAVLGFCALRMKPRA